MGPPAISVIVPVRNDLADLRALLGLLAAQTLPRERFEVIVGDDGSTDGVAGELAGGDGWIDVVSGPPRNAYSALNRAARRARAPSLAVCDADSRPEPGWLEAGLAGLERADLVGGMIRFIPPERRSVWALIDMDAHLDHERLLQIGNGLTGNLFVRRELFDRVDGFDDALPSHGDFDFVSRCVAAGGRVLFAPDAVVRHPTRQQGRPFLRKFWEAYRSYAVREARAGRRPDGLKLREWVPLVQPLRARRRFGRPLRLDRARAEANGIRFRLRDDLRALPVMYVLLPYVAGAAQLRGWRDGRRLP